MAKPYHRLSQLSVAQNERHLPQGGTRVIRFARDYYKSRFDAEQVSDIKNALNLFGDDRQSHQAAGDFLYFTARQKGEFDNREQIKARREVNNVVEGNYDQQQKRGFSMRR